MAYSRAVQLIEAADACTKISTIVEVLPTKEVARPRVALAGLRVGLKRGVLAAGRHRI